MKAPELVMLGASSLKNGNARWQCFSAVANDNDDTVSYGELGVYQGLGLTSLPFPKDASGHAEGIMLPGVAGKKGVVVGARDTRSGKVVGKMDPGDTVIHSTDPDETAQVRVQGKKKAASMVVKGKDGKHLMVILDGENGKIQIMAKGAMVEIDDDGGISLLSKGGAGLLLQGKDVVINGNLKLPGMPPQHFLVAAPMPQFVGLVAAVGLGGTPGPVSPVMNVGGNV